MSSIDGQNEKKPPGQVPGGLMVDILLVQIGQV